MIKNLKQKVFNYLLRDVDLQVGSLEIVKPDTLYSVKNDFSVAKDDSLTMYESGGKLVFKVGANTYDLEDNMFNLQIQDEISGSTPVSTYTGVEQVFNMINITNEKGILFAMILAVTHGGAGTGTVRVNIDNGVVVREASFGTSVTYEMESIGYNLVTGAGYTKLLWFPYAESIKIDLIIPGSCSAGFSATTGLYRAKQL